MVLRRLTHDSEAVDDHREAAQKERRVVVVDETDGMAPSRP
jgi:hypothetical protein